MNFVISTKDKVFYHRQFLNTLPCCTFCTESFSLGYIKIHGTLELKQRWQWVVYCSLSLRPARFNKSCYSTPTQERNHSQHL